VVPAFGVAAGLVPVAASAAGRTPAVAAASAVAASAPARAVSEALLVSPMAASSNFWIYETNHRESTISGDNDYDFSAKMTHEMEKVSRDLLSKGTTKVSLWLAALSTAINLFVKNHPHAAAIVAFVAAVLAVVGVTNVKGIWKWLKGVIYKGTHRRTSVKANGFWAKIFTAETSPPKSYQGWTARTCSTDAIRCGSPGDHNKENWP
jgi:hypothetical protein